MPLCPICHICLDPIHPDEDYLLDPNRNGLSVHCCCYVRVDKLDADRHEKKVRITKKKRTKKK